MIDKKWATLNKQSYRDQIMNTYRSFSGKDGVPFNQSIFTLGGLSVENGKLLEHSELNYFRNKRWNYTPFLVSNAQYVSCERSAKIHRENSRYTGPCWLRGSFEVKLKEQGADLAIVAADLMCGWKHAEPIIRESLRSADNLGDHPKLWVFNVCSQMNIRGPAFTSDPYKMVMKMPEIKTRIRRGTLVLAHQFGYPNQSTGPSANKSRMHCVMFWGTGK